MPTIAIIGGGFSGLCAAIQLKQAGFKEFVLFEKTDGVGGTWRANTYPGAECDVASPLYSFSFEQNPHWPKKWAHQPYILEYMEACADKYQLREHLYCNTEITEARFNDESQNWQLRTASGEQYDFDRVIMAVGQLNRPQRPDIPGLDSFAGAQFHSAEWNHDFDLDNKAVAVIGNAASAIQFIPMIAPLVKKLTIFQRSANWILPKLDKEYSRWEKRLAKRLPFIMYFYRCWLWLRSEVLLGLLMMEKPQLKKWAATASTDFAAEHIRDERLREKLIPDYPVGAKRILFSDNYYASLDRDNVVLSSDSITAVDREGVITADGQHHAVDALIYATGFKATEFLAPIAVTGKNNRQLGDEWNNGAEAYLGITVNGFPNLFMLYGPNTNLGHNSIVIMIESQMRYILSCFKQMKKRKLRSVEVQPSVQQIYNRKIQQRLKTKTWATIGQSWYMKDGKIVNNWPGTTMEYWWRTRRCDLKKYSGK